MTSKSGTGNTVEDETEDENGAECMPSELGEVLQHCSELTLELTDNHQDNQHDSHSADRFL